MLRNTALIAVRKCGVLLPSRVQRAGGWSMHPMARAAAVWGTSVRTDMGALAVHARCGGACGHVAARALSTRHSVPPRRAQRRTWGLPWACACGYMNSSPLQRCGACGGKRQVPPVRGLAAVVASRMAAPELDPAVAREVSSRPLSRAPRRVRRRSAFCSARASCLPSCAMP